MKCGVLCLLLLRLASSLLGDCNGLVADSEIVSWGDLFYGEDFGGRALLAVNFCCGSLGFYTGKVEERKMGKHGNLTVPRKFKATMVRKSIQHEKIKAVVKKTSVGIGCLNVNGLNQSTMMDVKSVMAEKDLDVVCLQETKLKLEDVKKKIKMGGCDVFESRRSVSNNDKEGGGLAVLTRQKDGLLFSRYSPKIENPNLAYVDKERMWIIYDSRAGKTAICNVYLGYQDNDDRHGEWNEGILSVLEREIFTLRGKGYRINLQGDFNSWVGDKLQDGGIPGNDPRCNLNGDRFRAFLDNNNLTHLNGAVRTVGDWSTRISKGIWTRHAPNYGGSTVLDYSVVSSEHLESVKTFEVDQNGIFGGASDHNFLFTRLIDSFVKMSRIIKNNKTPGWNIKDDQDWSEYRRVVIEELSAAKKEDGTSAGLNQRLSHAALIGLERGVGYRSPSTPITERELPRHIVDLMKERKTLEEAWKKEKSIFASSRYSTQSSSVLVAAQVLQDKVEEVEEVLCRFMKQGRSRLKKMCKSKSKRARKLFWKHTSLKERNMVGISALQSRRTGVLLCDPQEIADEVFQYLKDIFKGSGDPVETEEEDMDTERGDNDQERGDDDQEGGGVMDHGYGMNPRPVLDSKDSSRNKFQDPKGFLDRDFSLKEVKEVISSLGNGKAAGWDRIPNEALKEAPEEFVSEMVLLYNRVKNSSRVPEGWKRGRLVLVHKKGPTVDVNNYRPLTVLVSMSGVYSKLLNLRLTSVVEAHNLLGEIQHGFRKGRSGAESSFIMNTILWQETAKRKNVHMAFLDLVKAYDSVDRDKLWRILGGLGCGGKFLDSLKKMYEGDYIVAEVNGVSTAPVYLRRGLRQGCSLSPMLFALYISGLGQDLMMARQGVKLFNFTISALFFADDIVLIARTAEGLRELLEIVQRHCADLKMSLSVAKSKVISSSTDVWAMFDGEEVVGCLEKVHQFKYLGVETTQTPAGGALAMRRRAELMARRYKGACLRVSRAGPDLVEMALCTWCNIAIPSILFGCESVPFTTTFINNVERMQCSVAKDMLRLDACTPNVVAQAILGVKSFKEVAISTQLKFFLRVFKQESSRWSKDAMSAHFQGTWRSPYIAYIEGLKREVGMTRGPVSARQISLVVERHCLQLTNDKIFAMGLPALDILDNLVLRDHVNESDSSQVM